MADKVINIGNSDNKVTVNVTDKIVCPIFEGTATKVGHKLSFGNKTFDGSSTVILSGADLGSVDLTSELTITGLKTFSGETYLDSLNANTGLISGNLRVINGIFGNLTGNVIGNLSGNASTATKLQTSRTLTIGNTEKYFDGSSNVSWTLSEIGVASSDHTHNYIISLGNKNAADLSSTYPKGLSINDIYYSDWPFHYGCGITAVDTHNGAFQIAGQWNESVSSISNYDFPTEMYIRGRRDTYDVWTTWTRVLTDRNYNLYSPTLTGTGASGTWDINISGNSKTATNVSWSGITGKPTKLSDFTDDLGNSPVHTHSLYLTSHQSLANRLYTSQVSFDQTNVSWAKTAAKDTRRGFIYNTRGAEYSYLFGFSEGSTSEGDVVFGSVLKMGYTDNYLRILRVLSGTWKTDDWEKISAGYADNAGIANNVDWSGVTNKPNFVNSFGTKTGDITIRGGQTGNGSVNLAMSNNELLASIVGLGSNAYTSTAYLPLTGGTLNSDANIVWRDRGAWGDSSATYPYSYGGLCWSGTSDWIKIYGKEELSDLLNLWIIFGDDKGHAIKIDDNGNVYTVYHTGNLSPMTTSHPANSITKTNIDNWNAVHTWYTTATASDTTNTIDTWKEIEAFVSSFKKGDNLATYLANNYLAKSGGTMSGTLIISGVSTSSWTEGIRINNATNGWSTLTLGGTVNSGTGSDIWSLHTFNSNFYINNNGSDNLKATRLWGHSNGYTIGNTNISSNTLAVGGTFRATSSIIGDTSISAGTTVTAATSITSTAGDFYVGGTSGSRCHIKMDTTNKCIKFIFD